MKLTQGNIKTTTEFLQILSAFLAPLGWTILKNEPKILVLKNSLDDIVLINFNNFKNSYAYLNGYGLLAPLLSYDQGTPVDFNFTDPAYHPLYRGNNGYAIPLLLPFCYQDGINLKSYTIVANSNNFFCQIFLAPEIYYTFCSSHLNQTHDYEGGHLTYSTNFLRQNSINNGGDYGSPFGSHLSGTRGLTHLKIGNQFHSIGGYSTNINTRLQSSLSTANNYQIGYLKSDPLIPLLSNPLSPQIRDGLSAFTALPIVTTPHFFYKNDYEEWTHMGHLDDILIISNSQNLPNLSQIYLGNEKFIIFKINSLAQISYGTANKNSDGLRLYSAFAVRLDDEI